METENKHWTSKVKVFKALAVQEIEKTLNEFYKNRFIIATQVFPSSTSDLRTFDLIVYYKIPPEAEAE